jgi:hypothetical protein
MWLLVAVIMLTPILVIVLSLVPPYPVIRRVRQLPHRRELLRLQSNHLVSVGGRRLGSGGPRTTWQERGLRAPNQRIQLTHVRVYASKSGASCRR